MLQDIQVPRRHCHPQRKPFEFSVFWCVGGALMCESAHRHTTNKETSLPSRSRGQKTVLGTTLKLPIQTLPVFGLFLLWSSARMCMLLKTNKQTKAFLLGWVISHWLESLNETEKFQKKMNSLLPRPEAIINMTKSMGFLRKSIE